MDEYIKIQREEAKQVEAHRILFSLGVYGVMYLGIWLYTDSRSLTSSNNVSGVHKMGLEEEEL